jgi:uncharacterized protein YgbK (DUF1537 family)
MRLLLGCIADDFTGATDLANNLVRAGMRVVQTIGVPTEPLQAQVDAVVVALKSRTLPPDEAVAQSLAALRWLQAQHVEQVYFKYCSTFDSWYRGDVRGNIGPVTEALMAALGCNLTIATPAFPDNQRTVFKGHLFVGDVLLSDSGMKDHPLTPMNDANLVRVLQAQCQRPVGLVDYRVMAQGADAIRTRLDQLRRDGVAVAVVDALSNDDLIRLGPALKGMPLITAGSGVAIGLPANWGLKPTPATSQLPPPGGWQAVVSGSCSQATRGQVARFQSRGGAAWAIDPLMLTDDAAVDRCVQQALAWATPRLTQGPVLIYSTADPVQVQAVQQQWGVQAAGERVEQTLARIAQGLVRAGVRQLVVAGGETSGACVQALQISQLQIGAQIDPGVPWCYAHSPLVDEALHLTLKSGNFGGEDFFHQAFVQLQRAPSVPA